MREWVEKQRDTDALATMRLHWPEPKLWDLLDQIGDPLRASYWQGMERMPNHDEEQSERVISNLLDVGNAAGALATAGYRSAPLPTTLLVRVLESITESTLRLDDSTAPGHGYFIDEIFTQFDCRDDNDDIDEDLMRRIVELEFRFLPVFDEETRAPRFVWRALEQDPCLYVELLRLIYRAENQPARDAPSSESVRLAENAHTILASWHSFPGVNSENLDARDEVLHDWAVVVLESARESGHVKIAQQHVGEVLARPKAGRDGYWPSEAARRLLESGAYPELGSGLEIAKRNLRGTTIDGIDDDGNGARELASLFEHSANAIGKDWPVAALMLYELSARYLQDAEDEDREVREQRAREGYPP